MLPRSNAAQVNPLWRPLPTERAKNCTWRLMTLSVGSNLIMATLLALFAPAIPNIYNTEPHVRQIATQLIYVVARVFVFALLLFYAAFGRQDDHHVSV